MPITEEARILSPLDDAVGRYNCQTLWKRVPNAASTPAGKMPPSTAELLSPVPNPAKEPLPPVVSVAGKKANVLSSDDLMRMALCILGGLNTMLSPDPT